MSKMRLPISGIKNCAYEPNGNVLLTKANQRTSDNATISSVTYEVNSIGQRKKRTTTDATATSAITDWNYDTLGQVTSEDKPGTDTDRAYQYDTIGNRLSSSAGVSPASSTTYTSNALNQYTAISGGAFQAPSPTYDNDGNQINAQIHPQSQTSSTASLSPVSCVFSWDAQNRLIEVKDLSSNSLVEHHYDSYSRKIATITSPLASGEGQGAQLTTLYIYNGWNSIAEYRLQNSSFTLRTSLLWGPDLSGSEQGAGGVGGLLSITNHSSLITSYFPLYDGNGNISEYLDCTGVIAAHYEYDAYGNTTVATGTKASDFTYRFSTKPIDTTSGLYYYGYRWYESLTGRWPSRDPIEESGGVNLYGFVDKEGISIIDVLGLDFWWNLQDKFLDGALIVCEYCSGAADSLTCGATEVGRNFINDQITELGGAYVIQNKAVYKTGEYTEIAVEVALSGGSSLLKKAAREEISKLVAKEVAELGREVTEQEAIRLAKVARVKIETELRDAARDKMKAMRREFVHHIQTLYAHPWIPGKGGGFRHSYFPTLGVSWIANASWNLAKMSYRNNGWAKHVKLHQRAWKAEKFVMSLVSPALTSLRVGVNQFRDAYTLKYQSDHNIDINIELNCNQSK